MQTNLKNLITQNTPFFMRRLENLTKYITNRHGIPLLVSQIKVIRIPPNVPEFETTCSIVLEEGRQQTTVMLDAIKCVFVKDEDRDLGQEQGAVGGVPAEVIPAAEEIVVSFKDVLESVRDLNEEQEKKIKLLEEENKRLKSSINNLQQQLQQRTTAASGLSLAQELLFTGDDIPFKEEDTELTVEEIKLRLAQQQQLLEETNNNLQQEIEKRLETQNELDELRQQYDLFESQETQREEGAAASEIMIKFTTRSAQSELEQKIRALETRVAQMTLEKQQMEIEHQQVISANEDTLVTQRQELAHVKKQQATLIFEKQAAETKSEEQSAEQQMQIRAQAQKIKELDTSLIKAKEQLTEYETELERAIIQSAKELSAAKELCNQKDEEIKNLIEMTQTNVTALVTQHEEQLEELQLANTQLQTDLEKQKQASAEIQAQLEKERLEKQQLLDELEKLRKAAASK